MQTRKFDGLAEGPFNRLVIRNVMVVPGHGGPPSGPNDILIEGNVIRELRSVAPASAAAGASPWTGDRVIDGTGLYVMPGMIDLHHHTREAPIPLDTTYYLKLAHGVTTGVAGADARNDEVQRHHEMAERYEKLAPRLFPIWQWGRGTKTTLAEQEDPVQAPRIAREMRARGVHVVDVGRGAPFWTPALLAAVCAAVTAEGGITTFHIPPSTTNMIDAVDAARAGVTMIEHLYGYAEAALPGTQDFPRDYDYDNENHRFRQAGRVWLQAGQDPRTRAKLLGEVVDALVASGVTMLPTACHLRSQSRHRPRAGPAVARQIHAPVAAGVVSAQSQEPRGASLGLDIGRRGLLVLCFQSLVGTDLRVQQARRPSGYGADDNFQWATAGFSNVRELQLLRESGMHNLEVLKAATYNSALTLRQPKLGLVHPGYLADLILVDGNPAENFRYLYSFGAVRLDAKGTPYRTRGIVHTIKDGVVIENKLSDGRSCADGGCFEARCDAKHRQRAVRAGPVAKSDAARN